MSSLEGYIAMPKRFSVLELKSAVSQRIAHGAANEEYRAESRFTSDLGTVDPECDGIVACPKAASTREALHTFRHGANSSLSTKRM